MAAEFQVSRSVIGEALRILEITGLVRETLKAFKKYEKVAST